MTPAATAAPAASWVKVIAATPDMPGIAVFAGDRVEVLQRMAADAIAYRNERAGGYCADCEREPGGSCYDHAGDEVAAAEYESLAAELAGDGAG